MLVIIILGSSVMIGKSRLKVDPEGEILTHYDKIKQVQKISEKAYYLYENDRFLGEPDFILSIAEAQGYSGAIKLGVRYTKGGEIVDVTVFSQTETPAFFDRVIKARFLSQYIGKSVKNNCALSDAENGVDVAAVSGATISCRGINNAVNNANQLACTQYFKTHIRIESKALTITWNDAVLLGLFLAAIILSFTCWQYKKQALFVLKLLSLVFIGFVSKALLSITHFNNLIVGNFTDNNLYWYVIVVMFIFSILVLGRNLYFAYLCPFGILQDYFGKLPTKKFKIRNRPIYKWPAILATIGLLSYGALFNQPGILGYEVFSAFFHFHYTNILFYLALVVLILSIFIKRFWCRFLCPVGVIGRFFQLLRALIKNKKA